VKLKGTVDMQYLRIVKHYINISISKKSYGPDNGLVCARSRFARTIPSHFKVALGCNN